MGLDTVLNIGKIFRESPSGWRYHRFLKSIEDEIGIYKKNKDSTGKTIETTVYQLPVKGNAQTGFEFDFDHLEQLTDESKIKSLLYLNFKTAEKDSHKRYLCGDIIFTSYKNKKGETVKGGNYQRSEDGKKPGSFERCKTEAESLNETSIGKFRECFEKHLAKIEDDLLLRHQAIVIHFAFENGKSWFEQDDVINGIKVKLLESFVFEGEIDNRKVYAMNKTLFRTIKPPVWDKKTNSFNDPIGVGGVTPGFANKNTYKIYNFKDSDEIWDLMYAIDLVERTLIQVRKDLGIIALPKGKNLTAENLLNFFSKAKSLESLEEGEQVLEASNEEEIPDDDWDIFFEPILRNTFDDEVEFDIIFFKPKPSPSSASADMVELASIKKSHLRQVHEKIRDVKIALMADFDKAFPKSKKPFRFDLKENFLNILTNKTKAERKYQFHLLKVLPQIYLDAYYEDPLLLPAFVERTEYNIRNEERFAYDRFRFNLLFLLNIQKNNPLMEITNSRSYAIGKCLGVMARPFAARRHDCPIKSFEKNYVGNLTRRIAYPEDLVKFSNFLNEKLAIHEKQYKDQQEASRQLASELKNMAGMKYNKNECALGFFESYFEKQESTKPQSGNPEEPTDN
jgi:hypothetical protein